ncbi:MAG: DNA primase, partial [Coriobacteriia bacterium]|nr:DNA primase [Coriobacteriia bacterium]
AVPLIRYGIDRRLAKYDLSTPEGRSKGTVDALSVLAPIKDSLLAKDYAVYIASRVRTREEDLLDRLAQLKAPNRVDYDERARAQAPVRKTRSLDDYPPAERNRIKSEREFLSLCAQNTGLVPEFFDTLGQTEWSLKSHTDLANCILDSVAADPAITPAQLIHQAEASCPVATRILTGAVTMGRANPHESLCFLSEELTIGDLEHTISDMREAMRLNDGVDDESQRQFFDSIMVLQQELNHLRRVHTKHE